MSEVPYSVVITVTKNPVFVYLCIEGRGGQGQPRAVEPVVVVMMMMMMMH